MIAFWLIMINHDSLLFVNWKFVFDPKLIEKFKVIAHIQIIVK